MKISPLTKRHSGPSSAFCISAIYKSAFSDHVGLCSPNLRASTAARAEDLRAQGRRYSFAKCAPYSNEGKEGAKTARQGPAAAQKLWPGRRLALPE